MQQMETSQSKRIRDVSLSPLRDTKIPLTTDLVRFPRSDVSEPRNWIRLAQRFQVWVTPEMPEEYPLRVGATASAVVYTQEKYWLNQVTEIWHQIVAHWNYLY
jgi:hypothetical protein